VSIAGAAAAAAILYLLSPGGAMLNITAHELLVFLVDQKKLQNIVIYFKMHK